MKYTVKFNYKDSYPNGKWSSQYGSFSANNEHEAVEKCKI